MDFDIVSESTDQTIEIGNKIGAQLKGGEVFAIIGPLGSGKTHLIKGIAAGAGAKDSTQVNSPTFVIVNEYAARLDIYHIDAYRLNSTEEFDKIGFDDFCRPDSVVLIEWADKIISALKGINFIQISLSHLTENQRNILIQNTPEHMVL
ncbi:MAG: tRNA (adenosine(37)-N6)-threonylcarbamoyltransferase complex ATPase subunit type 1 TsaE [Planctomycetes bacterium]|nr:tRNA (adenosine(37)-N6)-threonylcarbamoyltransferase complex ATPase subunit type 1 TsaE [Planctomycetota bacterium]